MDAYLLLIALGAALLLITMHPMAWAFAGVVFAGLGLRMAWLVLAMLLNR